MISGCDPSSNFNLEFLANSPQWTARLVSVGSQYDNELIGDDGVVGRDLSEAYSWSEPSPIHTVGGEEINNLLLTLRAYLTKVLKGEARKSRDFSSSRKYGNFFIIFL